MSTRISRCPFQPASGSTIPAAGLIPCKHVAQQVSPSQHDIDTTFRDIAATIVERLFPASSQCMGTLPLGELRKCQPDARGACQWAHLDDRAHIHYKRFLWDTYPMDDTYYTWHDVFGKMVLNNFGVNDLFALSEAGPAFDAIIEKMLYAVVTADEAKVLLTG